MNLNNAILTEFYTITGDITSATPLSAIPNEFVLSGFSTSTGTSFYISENGSDPRAISLDPTVFYFGVDNLLHVYTSAFNSISTFNPAISALSQLVDVNITGLSANEYLQYNGTSWVPSIISAAPVITQLSALSDVNLSALSANDYLQYNGTSWIAAPIQQTSAVSALSQLSDVNETGLAKNLVLKYNGTKWVPSVYNASFTFSIGSFTSNGGSGTQLIGFGIWKSIGSLTFNATYNNGPATASYVSLAGWSNLTLGNGFLGPTVSISAVNYPGVGSYQQFALNATDGTDNSTTYLTYYFYNQIFYGVSTNNGSYTSADIQGLATNYLGNSRAGTFSVNASGGQYIVYSYPTRLGSAAFNVGGFSGGFEAAQTVSVTNANGYNENYFVYRSTNSGLGATTVTVS